MKEFHRRFPGGLSGSSSTLGFTRKNPTFFYNIPTIWRIHATLAYPLTFPLKRCLEIMHGKTSPPVNLKTCFSPSSVNRQHNFDSDFCNILLLRLIKFDKREWRISMYWEIAPVEFHSQLLQWGFRLFSISITSIARFISHGKSVVHVRVKVSKWFCRGPTNVRKSIVSDVFRTFKYPVI